MQNEFGTPSYAASAAAKIPEGWSEAPPETSAGTPPAAAGRYAETYARLRIQGDLSADTELAIVYTQREPTIANTFPRPLGGSIALQEPQSFIRVYSAAGLIPSADSSGLVRANGAIGVVSAENSDDGTWYQLSIFDPSRSLWVNPVHMMPDLDDAAAPRIAELALSDGGASYVFQRGKRQSVSLAQSEYLIAVNVRDPQDRDGIFSGCYAFKIIIDGRVARNLVMDSAAIGPKGMDFLQAGAPSGNSFDSEGRLLFGKEFFARGSHTIELVAADFAGNESTASWNVSIR